MSVKKKLESACWKKSVSVSNLGLGLECSFTILVDFLGTKNKNLKKCKKKNRILIAPTQNLLCIFWNFLFHYSLIEWSDFGRKAKQFTEGKSVWWETDLRRGRYILALRCVWNVPQTWWYASEANSYVFKLHMKKWYSWEIVIKKPHYSIFMIRDR